MSRIKKILVNSNIYKLLCSVDQKWGRRREENVARRTTGRPVRNILSDNDVVTAQNFTKTKGFICAARGDYHHALQYFKEKLDAQPANSYHRLGLAYTYYLMKEYSKSEEQVWIGLALDASNPFLYTALGYIYIEENKIVDALDMFEKSEDIQPGYKYNSDGINRIVNFAAMNEGLLKGIDNQSSIERIAKNPNKKSDYIRLISNYESLQDAGRVSEIHAAYLEKFPTSAEAIQRYAQFLLRQGRFEESREWYYKVVDLAPDISAQYIAIGQTYLAEGKFDIAVGWYKKSISVNPDNLDSYYKLVELVNLSKRKGFDLDKDEIMVFVKQFVKNSEIARSYYDMIEKHWQDDAISEWVASDLWALIQMAKQHGIQPILQSYPYEHQSNSIAEYLAERQDAIFVDQADSFERLMQSGKPRSDFFSGYGHCNDKGYMIMAKNLYEKITSDEYFRNKIVSH